MKSATAGIPAYEYTTYPRQFVSYKWYKPVLVALLAFVFMVVFQVVLLLVAAHFGGGVDFLLNLGVDYDNLAPYNAPAALALIGGVATMLPALALAALIVRDRPFSSYSSSRGGWNWSAFGKCLLVALVVTGVPSVVQMIFFPDATGTGVIAFTVAGAIACLVLVPLQCMAEEYVFRGLIMQAVGAWTQLPVFAIVVSALVFAAGHPYNLTGMIAIFISGVIWGVVVWQTKGLEATGATHIVNNMLAFGAGGLGLTGITSEIDIASLVLTLVVDGVYAAIVIFAGKKYNWFTPKGDGVSKYNEKRIAKMVEQGKLVLVPAAGMPVAQPGAPMPMPQQPPMPMPLPQQQPGMPAPAVAAPPAQPGMPLQQQASVLMPPVQPSTPLPQQPDGWQQVPAQQPNLQGQWQQSQSFPQQGMSEQDWWQQPLPK